MLPLAHQFEFSITFTLMYLGVPITFSTTNPKTFRQEVTNANPTLLCWAPIIPERLKQNVEKTFDDRLGGHRWATFVSSYSFGRWLIACLKVWMIKRGLKKQFPRLKVKTLLLSVLADTSWFQES